MSDHQIDVHTLRPPLSEAELVAIRPYLMTMAKGLTRDRSLRDDLVSEAVVRLIARSNWVSVSVTAYSAMLNYLKVHGDTSVGTEPDEGRYDPPGREPEALDNLIGAETGDIERYGLSDRDTDIIRLLSTGATWAEVRACLGVDRQAMLRATKRFREAITGS